MFGIENQKQLHGNVSPVEICMKDKQIIINHNKLGFLYDRAVRNSGHYQHPKSSTQGIMDTYLGETEHITKMNYYQQASYLEWKFQNRCEQEGQVQVEKML